MNVDIKAIQELQETLEGAIGGIEAMFGDDMPPDIKQAIADLRATKPNLVGDE